jgi:hypothetical protein
LYCYLNMPTINKTYLILSYLILNTTTVPAEGNSSKRPIVFNNCQVTNNKTRIFLKRQTKGIIYLASVLINILCN